MISRRTVIKLSGAAATAGLLGSTGETLADRPASAPLRGNALLKRGDPEIYTGDELRYIGMPVGGLFAGTVYLGGDGQLWNWDIFNQGFFGCTQRPDAVFMGETLNAGSGANYVDPVKQQSPFHQRFVLIAEQPWRRVVKFADIGFRGEYPIGKVHFADSDADVEMTLEAFSPFIPLEVDRSSFPATTQTYTVKNVGDQPAKLQLHYAAENPVLIYARKTRNDIQLEATQTATGGVLFSAVPAKPPLDMRADIVFVDWSDGSYGKWITTGTAFGDRPYRVTELPAYMGPVRAGTAFVVNSHQVRHGENVEQGDAHTGTLTSPEFVLDRKFLNLRVGGGHHPGETCVNLLIGDKVVRTVAGRDSNVMHWESFDVREFVGQSATLQVVDAFSGPWGQISLGEVIFSDQAKHEGALDELGDFGTFCVELLGGANHLEVKPESAEVGATFTLAPGESKTLTFVVAWHFPRCASSLPGKLNWYATRWKDAADVASSLLAGWTDLAAATRNWNATWYDSTLPYWFLDRTFANTSILATTTCHRLDEGRFYFWEGSGCCAGTCTHVWGYAQAIGRVFPEVERYLRSQIDFKKAFHPDSGAIDYRCEFDRRVAVDGQASCIMRACREHMMAPDAGFLTEIWPEVKAAMEYLIRQDPNHEGILGGEQYNTLDAAWYGEIAWTSSLYLGALRASETMAHAMGDNAFADQCASLVERGSANMVARLFNGEYFINIPDPTRPESNNTRQGCHIDQIYGQSWVHQLGLARILPAAECQSALRALFRHSFFEDVWEYRRKNRAIPGGRWYAAPKEAGLIMCSFPKGDAAESVGKGQDAWASMYFNECMSGFEHQVASHMLAEGLLVEGLTILRAIHERYHPSKRNPYNEIECSDHYGRAMASFGAYVSLTGAHWSTPNTPPNFTPKLKGPFRCAYLSAQSWGTYTRTATGIESLKTIHTTQGS